MTALFVALVGTFFVTAGLVAFGFLFATARNAKTEAKRKTIQREHLARYLGDTREFLKRARTVGDDEAFVNEVQTWIDGMCRYISEEFGDPQVELLRHSRNSWRYSSHTESVATPVLENINENLGDMLAKLS